MENRNEKEVVGFDTRPTKTVKKAEMVPAMQLIHGVDVVKKESTLYHEIKMMIEEEEQANEIDE